MSGHTAGDTGRRALGKPDKQSNKKITSPQAPKTRGDNGRQDLRRPTHHPPPHMCGDNARDNGTQGKTRANNKADTPTNKGK